jgi:diaminohydroxyphosphoribosylaminopyrimidine deaminase/5-amino-6-(5-phosphoribosylamino)uracil reductase
LNDRDGMLRALAEASRALGTTRPNPPVGAVIARDGVVLGAGHTSPPGGPHAEVVAIAAAHAAGFSTRGASLYVTLEPCCHHGRTPPCTAAILAAGITRVVVGVVDPFEPMQGRSLALLRASGVEVVLGVEASAAAALMQGFLRVTLGGLPEVTVKIATTADGCLADAEGSSKWITGSAARLDVHRERARHDAVVVGRGTVVADDPSLDARDVEARAQPTPVVFDTWGRVPRGARCLRPGAVVVTSSDAAGGWPEGVSVVEVARGPDGRVDVRAAMRALGERGLHRLWVEGGASLHRALLDADVVDRVVHYHAGFVLPGGRPWVDGVPAVRIEDARRWGAPEVMTIGEDVRVTWRVRPPEVP